MTELCYRLPGWERKLHDAIDCRRRQPFHRARNDCVRFTCEVIQEITGVFLGGHWVKDYRSNLAAKRLLKKLGEDGFFAAANAVFVDAGLTPVTWQLAQRGDPVFFNSNVGRGEQGLAICVGQMAVTPGKDQMIAVPMNKARAAWHIPPHG